MADRWALIAKTDNSWDGVALEEEPTPDDDHYVVFVPADWPEACAWNSDGPGWKDLSGGLLSIANFKRLFGREERLAIRAALAGDPIVEDFWDLLGGCINGVSLTDPDVIAGVHYLTTTDPALITSDRATEILAGNSPA